MINRRAWANLAFLILSLGLSTLSVASALQINGITTYKELNKEYYIAALLLEDIKTTRPAIESYKKHKQMKLLVTASRWSARLWQQQWQNNIAINNAIITNDHQLQYDLEFFTGFLKGKLVKGDEITIDYTPGRGTRITLNQYQLIQTNDDKIFTYLLNTWIGKLPPSRTFKSRILNGAADLASKDLITLLNSNTLSKRRIKAVNEWYTKPKNELLLANNARLASIKRNKSIEKESKYKEFLRLKGKKKQQELKDKSDRLKRENIASNKRKNREKAEKAARVAALKHKKQKNKEAQLAQYYYKDLYEWQLRQAVQGEVRYPAWAKQFSQEGMVEAQFTINRKGKVTSVILLDDAVPKMLGSEVTKAIHKAGLKTLPPSTLTGSSWSFSVNYLFNLKVKSQALLTAPVKPKHLLASHGKRDNKAVSEYMDVVRTKVIKALKYPSEAVILKKRGKASLFITVDRQGKVIKIFERFKPKHATFTKALASAVNRSKPLPVMPAGVAKDKLTIDISYNFSR